MSALTHRVFVSQEDRTLAVALTDMECDEIARQLAAEVRKLADIESDKKAESKRLKDLFDAQQAFVLVLTDSVNTKTGERLVPCDIIHDYGRRVVETVRRDTNEVVSSRSMTRSELEHGTQMSLDDWKTTSE